MNQLRIVTGRLARLASEQTVAVHVLSFDVIELKVSLPVSIMYIEN